MTPPRPNPLLAPFSLALGLAAAALLGWVSPALIGGLGSMILLVVVFEPGASVMEKLQKVLMALTVIPFVMAGLLAPFRAVTVGADRIWPAIRADFLFQALGDPGIANGFDLVVGGCGVLLAFAGGLSSFLAFSRQMRQVENLPRSSARSAALGLSEFRGVARAIPERDLRETQVRRRGGSLRAEIETGEEPILLSIEGRESRGGIVEERVWNRFHLEDRTGRILVDPKGAEFWSGIGAPWWEGVRKILLVRRHQVEAKRSIAGFSARCLLPGDPIYVIGSVEIDRTAAKDAADAQRLVVRPSSEFRRASLWKRLLLKAPLITRGSDYRHVFLLTDKPEARALDILRASRGQAATMAGIWLAGSLALAWMALRRVLP